MDLLARSRIRLLALAGSVLCLVAMGCGSDGGGTGESGAVEPAMAMTPGLIDWPYFGRVPERTHYLPDDPVDRTALDPPLREAWSINTHALIEFPPAISGGVAYVINKYGNGLAVRLRDRKVLWELKVDPSDKGAPTDVTAPVYYKGRVFGAFLVGNVAAGDAATGKKIWEAHIDGHLESSPLPIEDTLYFGTDTTDVVALRTEDGKLRWKTNLPGAIKASPSFHDGNLFVADYESSMYSLDAKSGKVLWRSNTSKVAPFGKGGFFSSPAIAFGKVYAARDDGTVYAFDEKTGKVAWSFPTGAAVYGSPAVAEVPGTPATVYIGAENGLFFALDAKTGKPLWHFDVGGPIPGTSTVIGHTAYVSSFTTKKTVGIDVRDHTKTFTLDQAGYTPMVSDGRRLYLVGYYELVGLEPRKR
jgi:outer membrane protein assembly factor BamB